MNNNERIYRQLGIEKVTSRIINYIWLLACAGHKEYLEVDFQNRHIQYICDILDRHADVRTQARANLITGLIPERELRWIKGSRAQCNWIKANISTICSKTNFHPLNTPEHLSDRALSIAIFDFRSTNPGFDYYTKTAASEHLREKWEEQKKTDIRYDWMKEDSGEIQRLLFWKTLKNKHPHSLSRAYSFANHDELLDFIYHSHLTTDELGLINNQARKLWNQNKRRERIKDKKQCNLMLLTSTINKLDSLAKIHSLSRAEIVDILIAAEARDEYHIINVLNKKHLLLDSTEY